FPPRFVPPSGFPPMLTIFGKSSRNGGFCDGASRRDFLTIGGSLLRGLSLASVLRADARQRAVGQSTTLQHPALIHVYLPGGPPHMDMWDMKPDAPREIRGDFRQIHTNVPGIDICEMFPRMAQMADKFIFVRSLADSAGDHDGYQCMTGRRNTPAEQAFW